MHTRTLSLLALLGVLCARDREEELDAIVWMQTSAEHRALCLQTFNGARQALDAALRDPTWSAPVEQRGGPDLQKLPPAVIVDVDETVLDNTPFNARLVRDGTRFSREKWTAWVRESDASPVPGALAFLTEAARRGVTVFYVTNRLAENEEPTRANLARFGFPLPPAGGTDTILTRDETDHAGSEKSPRRARIAASYRVVLLIGDDLGDFVPGARGSRPDRDLLAGEFRSYWGRKWFMLPNPVYGSWEKCIPDKHAALITKQK